MTAAYNIRQIRELLTEFPDGLTIPEITEITQIGGPHVSSAIRRDERIYIDRWTTSHHSHQWVAVWCLSPLPVHAPKPAIKPGQYLRAMGDARV